MKKKISIIGLGYVGLPLALSFQKFFNVIGFDINHKRICELKKNYDSNNELSYTEIARAKKLNFSNNVIDITNSDLIIITVPTPINKKKKTRSWAT